MRVGINSQNKSKKKQYLGSYIDFINNIMCLSDKISSIDEELKDYHDVDLRMYRDSLLEKKEKLEEEAKRVRKKIVESICKLDDYSELQVLLDIFVKNMDIDSTAADVGYSVRHTYRILSRGIENIVLED